MNKLLLVLPAIALLSACAERPNAIAPVGINTSLYADKSCGYLIAEKQRVDAQVMHLSSQQNSAANNDAIGVFLLGIPTGSLTGGDVAGELAAAKGQQVSISQAIVLNKCYE